jgi:hypothetical protein
VVSGVTASHLAQGRRQLTHGGFARSVANPSEQLDGDEAGYVKRTTTVGPPQQTAPVQGGSFLISVGMVVGMVGGPVMMTTKDAGAVQPRLKRTVRTRYLGSCGGGGDCETRYVGT